MANEIDHERIAKLEAQVESLKEDVGEVKADIRDLHSRITTGNREIMDKLDQKIDELARNDKQQHEALRQAMLEVKTRVDVLERWRWMIVGAAMVTGWILNKMFS